MTTQIIYKIVAWNETFETAESRKHKSLSWVSMPIDRQSSGYQSMIDHFGDDAPAIYGAWCAMVSIAAACPTRGTLASSKGEPYSIRRIARMAHMPEKPFEQLFHWAIQPNVGWLVACENGQSSVETSHHQGDDQPSTSHHQGDDKEKAGLHYTTQQNTTQQNTTKQFSASDDEILKKESLSKNSYSKEFDDWYLSYPRRVGKPKAFKAFAGALTRIKAKHDDPIGWLTTQTARYKKAVANQEMQFVPHPSTWLNNDRYDDDHDGNLVSSQQTPGQRRITASKKAIEDFSGIGPGQRYDPDCEDFGEGF